MIPGDNIGPKIWGFKYYFLISLFIMTFSLTIAAIVALITLPVIVLLWATESKTTRARRMRRNGHTFQSIAKSIRMSESTARRYCKPCAA